MPSSDWIPPGLRASAEHLQALADKLLPDRFRATVRKRWNGYDVAVFDGDDPVADDSIYDQLRAGIWRSLSADAEPRIAAAWDAHNSGTVLGAFLRAEDGGSIILTGSGTEAFLPEQLPPGEILRARVCGARLQEDLPTPVLTRKAGVTFGVDRVSPAEEPLPTGDTDEAVLKLINIARHGPYAEQRSVGLFARWTPERPLLSGVRLHPLVAAAHLAFSEHRPLTLSPDIVWLTIAQGVALHLRQTAASPQQKTPIVTTTLSGPEARGADVWRARIAAFADTLSTHEPALHALICGGFSTSTPDTLVASSIVLLDAVQDYYDYITVCICGIPAITLEGTPEDWDDIAGRIAQLRPHTPEGWVDLLLPLAAQFSRASRGDIDRAHWQRIYKEGTVYGGYEVTGWINLLFPYIQGKNDAPDTLNPALTGSPKPLTPRHFPVGLSRAPLRIETLGGGMHLFTAIAGLLGVTQDPETLSLRPEVGWAIVEGGSASVLLDALAEHATPLPASYQEALRLLVEDGDVRAARIILGAPDAPREVLQARLAFFLPRRPGWAPQYVNLLSPLPGILGAFYERYLTATVGGVTFWTVAQRLDLERTLSPDGSLDLSELFPGRWCRFAEDAGGVVLATHPVHTRTAIVRMQEEGGRYPVVAESVADLFARLLRGQPLETLRWV